MACWQKDRQEQVEDSRYTDREHPRIDAFFNDHDRRRRDVCQTLRMRHYIQSSLDPKKLDDAPQLTQALVSFPRDEEAMSIEESSSVLTRPGSSRLSGNSISEDKKELLRGCERRVPSRPLLCCCRVRGRSTSAGISAGPRYTGTHIHIPLTSTPPRYPALLGVAASKPRLRCEVVLCLLGDRSRSGCPYIHPSSVPGRPPLSRPPPVIAELNSYEVSQTLDERRRRRRRQYLVDWVGYGKEDCQWVYASDFDEDDALVFDFPRPKRPWGSGLL